MTISSRNMDLIALLLLEEMIIYESNSQDCHQRRNRTFKVKNAKSKCRLKMLECINRSPDVVKGRKARGN